MIVVVAMIDDILSLVRAPISSTSPSSRWRAPDRCGANCSNRSIPSRPGPAVQVVLAVIEQLGGKGDEVKRTPQSPATVSSFSGQPSRY